MVDDRRGLPGEPKSPAHRDAIRRAAQTTRYHAEFGRFFQLALSDIADDAERRIEMIRIARRLVVVAPSSDRARWRHWLDLLEAGVVFRMKTYPVKVSAVRSDPE